MLEGKLRSHIPTFPHTMEYLVITTLTKASDNFVASLLNKGHLYENLIEMSLNLYLVINIYPNLSVILDGGCDGISFGFFRLFFCIPHPSGCKLKYLQN